MPVRRVLEWPFAPHAGIRSVTVHSATRNSEPYTRMVLTASFGGDLTGIELSVGLDLDLPPQDTAQVFGASEHLIGQLVAPESAPATKHTVQLDFRERLEPGIESFDLTKLLASFAKTDLLVLDDFGLAQLNSDNRRDLLEDRYASRSTLVTSQLPLAQWHERLADAILDRLVHNAYKPQLKGGSMRKHHSGLTHADHGTA